MKKYILLAVLIFIGLIFNCWQNSSDKASTKKNDSLLIFAGVGMSDVLYEIIDSFHITEEIKIQTNLASSGTLARQIEQGIIPHIYLSANKKWADYVDSLGYVVKGFKKAIIKNSLVLIANKNSLVGNLKIDKKLDFISLIGDNYLSIGDPAHVPAGIYAKESLINLEWYDKIQDNLLPVKDVRAALTLVELGEASFGIVYGTDAKKYKKIKLLGKFPEKFHQPIIFYAEVCRDNENAFNFYQFIQSPAMVKIWVKHGFKPIIKKEDFYSCLVY